MLGRCRRKGRGGWSAGWQAASACIAQGKKSTTDKGVKGKGEEVMIKGKDVSGVLKGKE